MLTIDGLSQDVHQLKIGDEFVVRLSEKPTAGFRWTLEKYDRTECELLGDQISEPAMKIGGEVQRTWRFRATAPGIIRLSFVLGRSWEAVAAASANVTISVHPATE